MKKRFTATVALITLLSSSTVPTLTQAAEQLKVSQPNTTGDNAKSEEQDTVATSAVDTTETTKDTKDSSSDTKSSTSQSTTNSEDKAVEKLNASRQDAIKKIQQLSALVDKKTYINQVKNAKTVDNINTIVTNAINENSRQEAVNKAINNIKSLKNIKNQQSYIDRVNKAQTIDEINNIVNEAKQAAKTANKTETSHNNKPAGQPPKKQNSDNNNKDSVNQRPQAGKTETDKKKTNKPKTSETTKKTTPVKNKKNTNKTKKTTSTTNKKKTKKPKTAVAKPTQKYKKSTSSYKATQRQAMAAAAIAKLDDELQIGADESPVKITPNMTGKEFIEAIADYATEVADKNDLYASVMIAQACLESGFGTSGLASSPYYNLFGIKGAYKGKSVHMQTLEDGSNGMYSINAGFRDYPSPKESLEDYADLLSTNFYKGAHKSKTSTYRDATRFLTGRYATDRNYARKLNGIIEAYDLTQYDEGNGKLKRIKKITNVYYKVKPGDTIKSIAKAHHNSVKELKEWNKKTLKDVNLIYPGQKIIADQKVTYKYIKVKDSDDKQAAENGKFNLPLKKGSYTVTSPFGGRKAPNAAAGNYHEGIDLAVPMNSNVYAARDGVVFATGYDGSAGNYIFLYHGNGLFSNYFHLTSAKVKVGDHVNAGDLIAKSGSTGNSTGPHLHFGISHRLWGDYENPEDYLNFK